MYDRKWCEDQSNLLNDSPPWLLKQISLSYTLTLACPRTIMYILTNKCLAGNNSYGSRGNAFRFYMGQILLKMYTPCHGFPHLKETWRDLWDVQGSELQRWPTDANEGWLNWEHLEYGNCVPSDFHPPLLLLYFPLSPLQYKHMVTPRVLVQHRMGEKKPRMTQNDKKGEF